MVHLEPRHCQTRFLRTPVGEARQTEIPLCVCVCVSFAEGFLFVFGGQDENKQTLSSGEKYDPDANTWTALPPMHEVSHAAYFLGSSPPT